MSVGQTFGISTRDIDVKTQHKRIIPLTISRLSSIAEELEMVIELTLQNVRDYQKGKADLTNPQSLLRDVGRKFKLLNLRLETDDLPIHTLTSCVGLTDKESAEVERQLSYSLKLIDSIAKLRQLMSKCMRFYGNAL